MRINQGTLKILQAPSFWWLICLSYCKLLIFYLNRYVQIYLPINHPGQGQTSTIYVRLTTRWNKNWLQQTWAAVTAPEGGREGRGGMGAGGMGTLGKNEGLVGEKNLHPAGQRCRKIRGWQSNGKSPKESLRNAQKSQRKKFRMSRKKGTIEKWLRCKKSARNCSVERGEARRNIEITQIESEWPQQNPGGFRGVLIREIFSVQLNTLTTKEDWGGNPWKPLEMGTATGSSTHTLCAGKDRSIHGTHILHICRQLPGTSRLHGHPCQIHGELTEL